MIRIALRMLTGDTAKYVGLVGGVAFAVMLMAQQASIFVGLMLRTAAQVIDVVDADLWVMDPRVIYVEEIEPLPESALWRVRGVAGVDWATPFFKGLTVARAPDGRLQQVFVLGVDDASLAGSPPRMLQGSVEDLRRPGAIVLDRVGALFIWPGEEPAPGKVLEMADRRATVVGIAEASAPFTTFPVIYTRYSEALRFAPPPRKPLSYILVRAQVGEDIDALARRIEAETGLLALRWQDFAWRTIRYYLTRTGIPVNFGITVALGFIVGAAVVGQTFMIFVLENLRQFGALKAMGVSNGTLLRMVLAQAGAVAAIGYGLGIGLAALFFEVTGRTNVDLRGFFLPWWVAAIVAGAVVLIILVASVASIRKALTLDPAVVFK
ncbi:ABC transporter permease [Elioraea sp.]|uniref:ABC transporter permease n=1 Tax=Elioraea sp. TaxID=2185103 RepID=UPI0021DBE87F|nr:ABC transporter permease [Elioraea sp.]GIX09557.1 MAG: ABC transporter permease [Elioraea sp.]